MIATCQYPVRENGRLCHSIAYQVTVDGDSATLCPHHTGVVRRAHDTAPVEVDVRAVTVRVGDITPAGTVTAVEYAGQLLRVFLTIGGQTYTRRYDDLVSVTR